ncbi:MAG TPA: vWA domain-containing protein [Marinobacter sp.]|nr:vWA domain-containing protein [Marinobacter sp.]
MPKFSMLILLSLFIMPGALLAEETRELTLPAAADVRIIVDISGSMKKNDPGNLRQPAVRLLARMLPEGTQAGVWTFGQYVNMLVPHAEVTDEWRKLAIDRSGQINSVALRTNLGKAIEVASDSYITSDDLSNTHYILLTDGEVDISSNPRRNQQEETRILETILPKLVKRGARLHPVGLSSEADAEFLKQLASESGGRFQIAESASALSRAFYEALNSAIPQQQIPIKGNAFTVDSGVSEFTALIFRHGNGSGSASNLELIRPDGKEISFSGLPAGVRWVKEADYTLITVDEPLAGEWRIKGDLGEGSRVTVVSDLKMIVSDIPASFSPDKPMNLRIAFFEGDDKIVNPDFLQVLNVSLVVTFEDGRSGTKVLSGDQAPVDGIYADTIESLPATGRLSIDVVADGKTFARKFSAVTEFVIPDGAAGLPADDIAPDVIAPEVNEEPVIESPIDITLAEQPVVAEPVAVEPEEKPGFSMWLVLAAGAIGLLVLGLLIWLFLKRRNNDEAAPEQPELAQEVPEDAVPDTIPEISAEVEADTETEVETEGDQGDSEQESLAEDADDIADEDIPVADSVVEADELPEAEKTDDEDDDEFGLEDFDLSEFDDPSSDDDKQKK